MAHTRHAPRVLGSLHARLALAPPADAVAGLLLHTCHRVEWYSEGLQDPPIPELAGQSRLVGEAESLARLSQIAAGARSIIAGDRLVLQQVVQARGRVADVPQLDGFVAQAIDAA